jgi:hypothetical protein
MLEPPLSSTAMGQGCQHLPPTNKAVPLSASSFCLPAARMPARDALFFGTLPPELAALYSGAPSAVEAAAQAAAVPQPRQEQQMEQTGSSPLRGVEVAAGAAGSSRKRLWAAAD